nr:ble (bleomycin resistance) [Enterobacter cloacae]
MADHVTPNLPSRDFDVTEAFYAKLGFATSWKDRGWMILQRGGLQLEFFPILTSTQLRARSAVACGWMISMPWWHW